MRRFAKPIVVVSKCLEFASCRYDSERVVCPFVHALKPWVEFVPVCPEMEIGLGCPRAKIRVIQISKNKRILYQPATKRDLTGDMAGFASFYADSLVNEAGESVADGFILKRKSPSCGLRGTKFFTSRRETAPVAGRSSGLFADAMRLQFEGLAFEDEEGLSDPRIREHWLTKLYLLAEFRRATRLGSVSALRRFHEYSALQLAAYNQKQASLLDGIVEGSVDDVAASFSQYRKHLYAALKRPPRRESLAKLYEPAPGHYGVHLSAHEKKQFHAALDKYRAGELPIAAVRKTVQIWAVRYDKSFIREQSCFRPYPGELAIV